MGRGWQNVGAKSILWVLGTTRASCDQHPGDLPVPPSPLPLAGATLGKRRVRKPKLPTPTLSFLSSISGKKFSFPSRGEKSDSKLFVGGCIQSETAQLEDTPVSSYETVRLDRLLATEHDRTF